MGSSNLSCCFSLRTAGLILAILDIMIGIYTIVFAIVALGIGAAFPHIMTIALTNTVKNTTDLALFVTQEVENEAVSSLVATMLYVAAGLLLVDGVVTIVWGSILVHGIRKESACLMKIWMIFRVMTLIFEISASILFYTVTFSPLEFLGDICSSIIAVWLIMIVHYLRMDIIGNYKTLGKDDLKFNPL